MNKTVRYQRTFQVWAYTVSHGQLLLRSTKSQSTPTRIDILFKDTAAMCLPAAFDNLILSRAQANDLGLDAATAATTGKTVYRLKGTNFDGFVVAGAVVVHEDDREYDEPSEIYPT